ncbi:MAG: hypothetical protein AB7O24_20955 [Kofleriaceae bacterium]
MRVPIVGLVPWVAALVGCGSSEPANVEGMYTIAVTNRDNGCNFADWTVGESTPGIGVVINQEGADVSATLQGGVGLFLNFALGSDTYSGTIDGNDLDLVLYGNRNATMGNCTYSYNSEIHATADGDTLEGRVDYVAVGNGNPDCASIDSCVTFQDFNGTRPPQ